MPPFDHELAWHAGNGFRDPKDIASELIKQVESASEELIKSDTLSDVGRGHISLAVSDIKEIYRLMSLFIDKKASDDETRWRFQFRLVRLMDNLMTISSFRSVNENFKHASSVNSYLISQDNAAAYTDKTTDLFRHIQDEAAALNLKIAKSEKFARRVQPGVCRRAAVPTEAEGYQWTAIKRVVSKRLIKKDRL